MIHSCSKTSSYIHSTEQLSMKPLSPDSTKQLCLSVSKLVAQLNPSNTLFKCQTAEQMPYLLCDPSPLPMGEVVCSSAACPEMGTGIGPTLALAPLKCPSFTEPNASGLSWHSCQDSKSLLILYCSMCQWPDRCPSYFPDVIFFGFCLQALCSISFYCYRFPIQVFLSIQF